MKRKSEQRDGINQSNNVQTIQREFDELKRMVRGYKKHYDHNYFIEDIPKRFCEQFFLFSPQEIKKYWLTNTSKEDKYSLYIHIPFCFQRCSYCIYYSKHKESEEEVVEYLNELKKEIEFFGKDLDINFDTLYFGGGTPAVLSNEQTEFILRALYDNFNIKKGDEYQKTFELNPFLSSRDKLETLKRYGINRVSFGVQSLNKEVLSKNNRGYQSEDIVKKAIYDAQKVGFTEINVDLILGLAGSGGEDFLNSFVELAESGVDSISIYPLQPTNAYLKQLDLNEESFIQKIQDTITEIRSPLKEEAQRYGYITFNDLNYYREASSWLFVSEKHLGKGSREVYFFGNQAQAGCLGLGKYSDSYIREVVEYNQKRKPNAPFTLNDKLYEVRILDNRKEMLKYVFNKLAEGKVDLKEIEERFNLKLDKEFEEPLTKLRELNLIEVDKRSLSFKEGDPLTIFTACLFFIDRDIVLNTLRNI